ncbi:prophage ps3 protein 01 [Vibrio ichthyoenteri ATCC 700023]|uniref:Prophage ps3 protein 01 n=1 Tax=Vibrio ichthyoenteri ATCC 700023 TaxID=870968 RepID=F9RXR8_9VIBR|nr:type II toxin-antitoxin system antitoxin SocA domain-containing protein [Vibrio ichthyoenteri]EGU47543.1 prophage ps3 protein 01 [Vibrio ichthyoenteri ATCC 700023]
MATEFDVVKYILDELGEISAMKLQKLVYYSQAWSLVWDEEELFSEDFEAWANGPVLRSLYHEHRGLFKVNADTFSQGNKEELTEDQVETIDKVLEFYGDKSAQWLSNLTHKESPWKDARGTLEAMASSSEVLTKGSMEEYYAAL